MLSELLSKMGPGQLIGLTAVVFGISAWVIISLTAIICGTVSRYRRRQLAADLIHDLADRGMSAEEIERLLRASANEVPRHSEHVRHLLRQVRQCTSI
jgi:hypothetical protein